VVAALGHSPLQYWPVTVRAGLAKGARWTAFPFSSNWRIGGEGDVARCVERAGDLRGKSCWDLGAHFGIHTVGLALAVGFDGQVAAFEPDPVAFLKLSRHIRMNRLSYVKPYQAAASDVDGRLELVVAGALGSTVTHAKYEDEKIDADTEVFYSNALRLDTLVSRGEIRLPDFIKVDVEGHGAKAIAGAINAIGKSHPTMAFSLHSQYEWTDTAALLRPLDYRAVDIVTNEQIEWDAYPGSCTVIFEVAA
jgi:FkbM family methyltransferase